MKRYYGSIIKRGNCYHWRFKNLEGLYTSRVVKNAAGAKVTNYNEAEKIVINWSSEHTSLQQLKTKEETIQKIAEVKSLLKVCRIPLTELEDAFFAHPSAPTISPKHRRTYHTILNSLSEFASKMQIETVADVTEDVAQSFLAYYWNRGISAKTYNSVLDILRCVFRLMNKENNPFNEFKKKKVQTEERSAFTAQQLQQIWDTLNSPDYHMMHKKEMIVLYTLALYTGARCGDLCLLRWRSVDMENRIIRFIPQKTSHSSHKVVEIPIGAVLYEALSSLVQSSDYVLPNIAKRYQYNPSFVSHDTKKLLIAAGLTPTDKGTTRRLRAVSRLSFHGFRHTAASLLISNGVNPLVVRDILGHTTVDMTAHYTHINLDAKRKALQNLNILSSPSQLSAESFSSRFIKILPEKLNVVAQWLEENLTTEQKDRLCSIL